MRIMLKKFSLLIICLFAALSAQAQWSVSPELGLSAYQRHLYEWRPGIKVGAAVEYQFTPLFSLESGLYYTQRGYSYTDFTDYEYVTKEKPSLLRHMFQIPLRARFAWEVADEVRLFVGAGPYLGLFFANDWRDTFVHRNDDHGRTVEGGLSVMGGVEVKRFFVRLGSDLSFGDERYHAETISFGYRF